MNARRRKSSSATHPVNKIAVQPRQQPDEDGLSNRRGAGLLLLLALVAATAIAYQPAWHGALLWDDDTHLTLRTLQPASGLWRIWFVPGATQQYYPIVHSAFWLQHRLWGDHTLGYHLLNILLHALSAFLVARILRRLAALIFALHPVHVESVAWMTELKNTLSGFLYLAAAWAYLRFDAVRKPRIYLLALALFVLALLSKTVTATLPAALLLVFWWKRGRIDWKRDALPLGPFLILGAAAGWVTLWVEQSLIGDRGVEFDMTLMERGLIAGRAVWFYLGKLLWPANLIFIYPRWQVHQGLWWQYLYPLGLIFLLVGLWRWRKLSRAPLAALLLFCGILFPALGFFDVYPFRFSFVADHFQYLASIAMIALISAGMVKMADHWHLQRLPRILLVLGLGGLLGFLTWNQSRQYTDAETLYSVTIQRNPSCWMAHGNLGMLKLDRAPEEAMAHFNEALRLAPDSREIRANLERIKK